MNFLEEYPQVPVNFRFVTPIYHCNINNDGKICHDILSNLWTPHTTITEVLMRVSEMIKIPNVLNSLDSVKGTLYQDNKQEYLAAAKEWTGKFGSTTQKLKKEFNLSD